MQEAEIPETFCCSWGDICVHHISQDFVCGNLSLRIFKPEGYPDIIALLDLIDIDDNLRRRNCSQVCFYCGASNTFLYRGTVASDLHRELLIGTNNFLSPGELKRQQWRWKGWQGELTWCWIRRYPKDYRGWLLFEAPHKMTCMTAGFPQKSDNTNDW